MCARCGAAAAPGARFCAECGAALPVPLPAVDPLLERLARATAGEYDLLRELGRGGMAVVYLAWDRELARHVAIKVLRPELTGEPTMSQRFLQEARTAANLDAHPNVVRVYRATEARGLRYFVMRYVDGCSLEQLLTATGPLPPDLAAYVLDEVALALQYAHERGVVHRDVKPANILLDRQGGVAVTDFGIAKVADADRLTGTGFGFGTPHYMSPEQWRTEAMTPASDQYALGVVAYQTVAGAVPFDGTHYEVQERHLRAEPPALGALRPGVPAALRAVIEVMLAKRPADRFPNLGSVSVALAAIPRDPPARLRERLARLIRSALLPAPGGVDHGAPANTPTRATPREGAAPTSHTVPYLRSEPADADAAPGAADDDPPAVATAAPFATPATGLAVAPLAVASAPGATASDVDADRSGPADAAPDAVPSPRRTRRTRAVPALAAAGLVTVLAGAAVTVWTRGGRASAHRAPRGTDAIVGPTAAAGSALPAAVPATVTTDSDAAGTAAPRTPAAGFGAPATVHVAGAAANGSLRLPLGDSLPLGAVVRDAQGAVLPGVDVAWRSEDARRVGLRDGWAFGLAPGGPVVVAASAGAARAAVRVTVVPRGGRTDGAARATPTRRGAARPSDDEVGAAMQQLVAAITARDIGGLSSRLAPRAADGTPSRNFLVWLRDARGVALAAPPTRGALVTQGGQSRVAVRVPLRWRPAVGPLSWSARRDAIFWLAFAYDGDRWRGSGATLVGRFPP